MLKRKRQAKWAAILFGAFALFTAAVRMVDVQSIGPHGSDVGFAALNGVVHRLTGTHMMLYTITDWLSLVPLGIVLGFACLGLVQWIGRRSFRKVDRSILVLGGFYAVVMAAYVFFEMMPINYRPVLIEGVLEASYPSSTTMLVLCVVPTAMMQLRSRIRSCALRRGVLIAMAAFAVLMVTLRLVSGVHWFTDIVGGMLLSAGLVLLYACMA